MLIGLTGSIGSGKTEVGKIFLYLGAAVISADEIAHNLLLPEKKAYFDIIKIWGNKILARDGKIDRKKLASIIFADNQNLEKLNNIMHPLIDEEFAQKVNIFLQKGYKIILYDAPLLIELNLHKKMDRVIVVNSETDIIKQRLFRRGWNQHEIKERYKSQLPIEEKLKYADYVIDNNGTIEELKQKIIKIYEELKSIT